MTRRRVATAHDCGEHGQLTVRQISAITGITEPVIYRRVQNGVTGEGLLSPPKHGVRQPGSYVDNAVSTGNLILHTAVKLAIAHRSKAPTIAHLREQYGMSRATAYRWRAAFIDAGLSS